MKHVKTYEGFFDFFKSKPSEDDKIALEFIKRLNKVKGISPYKIKLDQIVENTYKIDKYTVDFEDTPIKLWCVLSLRKRGFDSESQNILLRKKLSKWNDLEFYGLNVMCLGELEYCGAKPKILKELVKLVEKVYKEDKEARRIENIKLNMNDAADLIPDEPLDE